MGYSSYKIFNAVADGDFISPQIQGQFERFYISITFYSDEYKTVVTPSAGTVTITATDDGVNYGTVTSGTVDVTTTYDRPNLSGRVENIKATLASVVGATHFMIQIHSFGQGV